MIIDELAQEMGFDDYYHLVAAVETPFATEQLELMLREEGS